MTKETNTIHEAIVAAMAEVHILGKDGKNSHQNYKFASIDAFLAMVNPIARKHGVFINITEIEDVELVAVKERNGESLFARFVYGIAATGTAGDSIEQSKQTVFLRFVGPQTTGQALAYAMKMYLRMLLLIPTGDTDADLQEQVQATGVGSDTPPPPDAAEIKAAIAAIEIITSMDELQNHWVMLGNGFKAIQSHKDVIKAKEDKKTELSAPLKDDANFLEGK